jgi:hypothetical protein
VKLQTSPSIILVPSQVEESVINALQPSHVEDHSVSVQPTSEFSFDRAKKKVLKLAEVLPYAGRLSLEIPYEALCGDGGGLIRMGGVIEWNKQVSVHPNLCQD